MHKYNPNKLVGVLLNFIASYAFGFPVGQKKMIMEI